EGDRALRYSDAILAIWSGLGWPWRAHRSPHRAARAPRSVLPADRAQPLSPVRASAKLLAVQPRTRRTRPVSRILLLGGYGGFGARIALRLADAGHDILVAGRSAA